MTARIGVPTVCKVRQTEGHTDKQKGTVPSQREFIRTETTFVLIEHSYILTGLSRSKYHMP